MPQTPQPNDPQFDDLRKLLAMKRAERPPRETMDNFLGEFHKRLADEQAADAARRANSWWLRLRETLGIAPAVPGDEAFPALRRLLSLKRYEHPSPAYLDNFLMRLNRRLLAEQMHPVAFGERLRQSLTERPLAFAQVGVAFALTFVLTIQSYNYWQRRDASVTAHAPAPTIIAAAAPERPVQVIYDDARANVPQEEATDSAVMLVPTIGSRPNVHFVMDRVDITPKVYAASFNY
ncbi:MAG: hypothetical protein HZC54_13610 [Verrucomicrobia bacterium]|nr:hypothetical protein [Verrucomicrobiota bacterium]